MKARGMFVLLAAVLPRAAAADLALTFEEALALARRQAPAVLAAQARIEEARGRLQGAAALFGSNPEIGVALGERQAPAAESRELEVGFEQRVDLWQRGGRVGAARADLERAQAASLDEQRLVVFDVGVAFYTAVHARAAMELAAAAESLSARTLHVAEQRHRTGDVAILDVNLARADLGHVRADTHAAAAASTETLQRLRVLLDIPASAAIRVEGELARAQTYDLDTLSARVAARPDVVSLAAAVRMAEQERRLGGALRWPELWLGASYRQEEDDEIVLGEVGMTLPVFERGQGLRGEAAARQRLLSQQLDALRRAATAEVVAAHTVYKERMRAVEVLARESLPLLDANERLAARSYATGQIGLAELLLVRNATLGMRAEYLDKQLEAAIAAIRLETAAGVLE